ncbi:MAG TPA: hypothetical protein VGV14_19600 [Rhodanobacter sp.]|nr:hypothetical protein [Rhodanobacter sp.]
MLCDHCHKKMHKIDRRTELTDLDDDATEGQMADYFAAELTGDVGAWGIGIVEYACPSCHRVFQIMTDELQSYDPLIVSWHEKAREGDYFSRFVFEYLAFCALLKNKLFIGANSDRAAIQQLKKDEWRAKSYVKDVATDESLLRYWQEVVDELSRVPLHNSSHDLDNPEIDRWWNSMGEAPDKDDTFPKGIVRSTSDWENMVEFWYGVRNNLFHGGKSPTIKRDCFLVEHAYLTLASFVERELQQMAT